MLQAFFLWFYCLSITDAVLLIIVVSAGYLILRQWLGDKRLWRPVIALLLFSSCLRQVGIGSLFMGIGHGIILLCGQHSVTSVPDDTARTAAVGWLSFFNSVGTAAGPLIGGKLRDLYGLHYGFSGAVLLSFGAILASFSMPSTQVKATIHSRAPLRIKKPLVLDIILSGTVFFVADVISVYLPLYTYQMALSGILTGTVLSANGVAQMIVRPFMGHLRNWFSVRRLLQSCLLICGVSGTHQVSRVYVQYLVRSPRSQTPAEPTHSCITFAHCCLLCHGAHRLPLFIYNGAQSLHAFALRLSHSSAYA